MSNAFNILSTRTCSYCDQENDLLNDSPVFVIGFNGHFQPMICKNHSETISYSERHLLNLKRAQTLVDNEKKKNDVLSEYVVVIDNSHLTTGE